jgi:hypothetical protein
VDYHAADIGSVDDSSRGGPVTIADYRDYCEQHGSESIWSVSLQQTAMMCPDSQSIEHTPPMSPMVLLYPTTKLKGFFHLSPLK